MTNPVIFRRATSEQLSTYISQDADSLIFIEDQNVLYKSTGKNKPLARYSDVQSGYVDLADLQSKVTEGVFGKLYLTADSKIYYYADDVWKTINAEADLSQFNSTLDTIKNDISALSTSVDNIDVDLSTLEATVSTMSNDVNKAITDSGTAMNKATTLEGKVSTNETKITTLESDVDTIENTLSTLQSSEGKIKASSTDTASYLEDKIDNTTVQIKDGKLVVKGIDGVNVGSADINQLSGVTSNIQVQLDTLSQTVTDSASGLSYIGNFPTKTDLENYANPMNGDLAVVVNNGKQDKVLYIYSEVTATWQEIGEFEFSDTFTGLRDTPDTYEADMFLKSDGSQLVYSKVKYSELEGKPNVTNSEIEKSVSNSHIHTNNTVLNKFTEDANGNVLYDSKELATNLTWSVFEF